MMVDRWKVPDQIASEDPAAYRVQRKDQNERESRSDHGSYLFVGAVGWTQKYAKVTTFADFCWLAALADENTGRCTKVTNFR